MLRKFAVWIFILIATLALGNIGIVGAQTTDTVRLVWNQSTLVLINISTDGVDVSELSLVSEAGEITPDQWVMGVDANSTLSYPLTNVRPGSCLVAYLSGTEPTIPETVSCTRVIGEAVLADITDVVWALEAGSFIPTLAGTAGDACDVLSRTSCNAAVNPANLDVVVSEDVPEEVTVRAIWNNDILALVNVSGYGADLSALSLTGNNDGVILPENWVMQVPAGSTVDFDLSDVRPGSCLIAYVSVAGTTDAAPELPENVSCDEIVGIFTLANPDDQVWSIEQAGFTPSVDDTLGEECVIDGATVCDITVPNADLDEGDTEEEEATASNAPVEAIWNNEILVLINVSTDGVDLSGLSLEGTTGGVIDAGNWIVEVNPDNGLPYSLTDVRPGSCLLAYPSATTGTVAPALPAGVTCTRVIAQAPLSNVADQVWSLEAQGFTPIVGGTEGIVCDVTAGTSCDIALP